LKGGSETETSNQVGTGAALENKATPLNASVTEKKSDQDDQNTNSSLSGGEK